MSDPKEGGFSNPPMPDNQISKCSREKFKRGGQAREGAGSILELLAHYQGSPLGTPSSSSAEVHHLITNHQHIKTFNSRLVNPPSWSSVLSGVVANNNVPGTNGV